MVTQIKSELENRQLLDSCRHRDACQAALVNSGYRALARLECDLVEGAVVLSGVVSTYYLKQLAQELVLRLKVVDRVHNSIQVERREKTPMSAGGSHPNVRHRSAGDPTE